MEIYKNYFKGKEIKLSYILIGGFSILLILIGSINLYANYNNYKKIGILVDDRLIQHTIPTLNALEDIKVASGIVLAETYDYILTSGEERQREEFNTARMEVENAEEKFSNSIKKENIEERERELKHVEDIELAEQKMFNLALELMNIYDSKGVVDIEVDNKKDELEAANDELFELIDKIEDEALNELNNINEEFENKYTSAIKNSLLFGFFSLIIGILIAFLLSRQITKPLSKLTEAVDEVSRGNFKVEIEKSGNINEINRLTDSLERTMTSMKVAAMENLKPSKKTEKTSSSKNLDIDKKNINK